MSDYLYQNKDVLELSSMMNHTNKPSLLIAFGGSPTAVSTLQLMQA